MFIFRKKVANSPFSKKIFFNFESYQVKGHGDVLRVINISLDLYRRASKGYRLHKDLFIAKLGDRTNFTVFFVKGLNYFFLIFTKSYII